MANQNDNRGVAGRYGIEPDDRTYLVKTVVLPAGESTELAGQFDWCALLAATADTIALSYNQGRAFQALPRGIAPTFPRTSLLVLKNTGGASSTIQVAYGLGEPPRDSRLVVVNGTQLAVQGIAGGVPVVVQGVAGSVPIATQDDPLPAAAMVSDERSIVGALTADVITVAANVRGAWVYFVMLGSTSDVILDSLCLSNGVTGVKYLRAWPRGMVGGQVSSFPIRDRPFFVPAGQNVNFVNPAGVTSMLFVNFKLVP